MATTAGWLQRGNEEQQAQQRDELDDLLEDDQLQQYLGEGKEIELEL